MAPRVPKGKTNQQRPTTRVRSLAASSRRPIFVGFLLTVVLLAMFAVKSLPSGAVTVGAPAARMPTGTAAALTAPTPIHVLARDRLVRVDAVLSNPPGRARGTHASRRAAASRARVTAIGNGEVKLSFTLMAGRHRAKLQTLTARLPSGMAFSHMTERLAAGIVVRTSGKRLKLTETLSHGKLTISLRAPASSVQVTIASPAITVSRAVAHRVRTQEIKALYTRIATTNTNHETTRLTLKPRTS